MECNFLDTLNVCIFIPLALSITLKCVQEQRNNSERILFAMHHLLPRIPQDCLTLVMCVVVVVDTESDVMVCAVSNVPESPEAPPSICG